VPSAPTFMATGAESALIGAVITDADKAQFSKVRQIVSARDFTLSINCVIYRQLEQMHDEGRPIDLVLLHQALSNQSQGSEAVQHAACCVDGAVPENAWAYAREIRGAADRRHNANEFEIAKGKLLDGQALESLIPELQKLVRSTSNGERLGHSVEEIENAPQPSHAIENFLPEWAVMLIAGLAGNGKTLTALAIVRALFSGGKLFHNFRVNSSARKVIYLVPESSLGPSRIDSSSSTSSTSFGKND
jgi:hypothetical protein